ncbi:hypothetical protein KKF63_06710 [bacterium]|nr:hypothetical protein [bacterium]
MEGFLQTTQKEIPQIRTQWSWQDWLGTFAVRLGIKRYSYMVSPGLYAAGTPTPESPVLVTGNYKLSFDHLRKHLAGIDAWILVVDTRGINVWCAGGKGTFSAEEVNRLIELTSLSDYVSHRKIILPQLAANGVCSREISKKTKFKVLWGPVLAKDIPYYLSHDHVLTEAMRTVTFTLWERLVLIPVELSFIFRLSTLFIILALFILSSICSQGICLSYGWQRIWYLLLFSVMGIFSGAVVTPLLLPWVPGNMFAVKGGFVGTFLGIGMLHIVYGSDERGMLQLALLLITVALSSYTAMNFTGSTSFTSPSGVEKEMRKAMPMQILVTLVALVIWVYVGVAPQ